MSRRWRQVIFQVAIIVALIVGLRLILGEWNWWLTAVGVVWLLLTNLWFSGARGGGTSGRRERP